MNFDESFCLKIWLLVVLFFQELLVSSFCFCWVFNKILFFSFFFFKYRIVAHQKPKGLATILVSFFLLFFLDGFFQIWSIEMSSNSPYKSIMCPLSHEEHVFLMVLLKKIMFFLHANWKNSCVFHMLGNIWQIYRLDLQKFPQHICMKIYGMGL